MNYSMVITSLEREVLANGRNAVKRLLTAQAENAENSIAAQLNEFIKRGLIVVEMNESQLVQIPQSDSIEVRQAVKLKLKDQEYIEKLEAENKELKGRLEAIQKAMA